MICMRFVFILLVCTRFIDVYAIGEEQSPLDNDDVHLNNQEREQNKMPYVVEEEQQHKESNFWSSLPTDCTSQCHSHLFATLRSALEGSTTYVLRDFHEMCRNYENTMKCLRGVRQCSTSKMYDSMTSGLKYMCVDQRDAIEAMLPCVNEVYPTIQPACELSCQTDRMAAGLTVKQLFQEDIKLLKIFDQHMDRLTTNEACRISQCMLRCYRTRMNVRCDGAAGSVLTEGLVRPYAEFQEIGSLFAPLMANVIPMQCAFLTDPNEMREFRIDPYFDQHIRTKYAEMRKMTSTQQPPQQHADPFQNLPMNGEDSPLDNE